jgi:hypothetical protein
MITCGSDKLIKEWKFPTVKSMLKAARAEASSPEESDLKGAEDEKAKCSTM